MAGSDAPGKILMVVDSNNNGYREIMLRMAVVDGQKYAEILSLYEWHGTALENVFTFGPDLGSFSGIRRANLDDDPVHLELLIGDRYGYGEETALAVIEISHIRPMDLVFGWQRDTLELICRYFTDDPTTIYETLHSAETYRACGFIERARGYYEILAGYMYDLQPWEDPWIVFPEDIADRAEDAAELERDYLGAFARCRLVQIFLAWDDRDTAAWMLDGLKSYYPPGAHGYLYAAMAVAYWQTYQETEQPAEACAAAKTAFENTSTADDPRITYYTDPRFWFYTYSGKGYSPNPDNAFNVPPDIASIIQIPICLD